MKRKRIGLAITGSHCNFNKIIGAVQQLADNGNYILPIVSPAVAATDTRFGLASTWLEKIQSITNNAVIDTIAGAEPVGPKLNLDVVIIAPCTGNTLAKLANSITDTAVLMAVKAQLRNEKPVVVAIATNDGLAGSAKNIGLLLDKKNVYFVPFGQDNPRGKPRSLVANMDLIIQTASEAMNGRQIQPILLR